MKYHVLLLMVIIIVNNIQAQDSTAAELAIGNLIINLAGYENNEGIAMIALSNSEEDYEDRGNPFLGISVKIENQKALWTFKNLPFGEYAIKTYHDENANGELDRSFFGPPTEDYGFSNNATGSFGPASWEDAMFIFDEDGMELNIEVD